MRKKDKSLLLIAGAAALFLLSNQQRQQQYAPQFQQVPPPPRNNARDFAAWASAIVNTFGNVAELWQPGGPFYNMNRTDVIKAAEWADDNPYTNPYGNLAGPVKCGCIPHTNRYV